VRRLPGVSKGSTMLQTIIRGWGRAEEFIVVALMGLAAYLTFQEVILRYVFGTGWGGSYEITVMSLIWCTFFAVSLGVRENVHIGVDLLVKKFDPTVQRILIIVSILFCILFGLIVSVEGFAFAHFISTNKLLSRDLRIPMEIGYLAVPVGGVLICLRFIERLVSILMGQDLTADKLHELSEEDKKKLIHMKD
jgi:C4-dicarboxylate transporter, DctQ subunit